MNKLGDLSCKEFLTELASAAPAPGGGGGAAMAGALAAALASMVANLTIGKEKFADREPEVKELLEQAEAERVRLLALVDEDAAVFNSFMSCYKLPKTTDEEKAARTAAIQQAYKDAAMVPFEIGELANQIFDLAELASRKGNQNLITDGIIAAINARAAVKSAFLNVRINLSGIKDGSFVAELTSKMYTIEKDLDVKESSIIGLYE